MKSEPNRLILVCLIVASFFAFSVMVGCEKKEEVEEKAEKQVEQTAEEPTEEKAPEPTTIRFTTWGSPASNKVYQDVVDQFQEENPDIKVELMMLPWSDYHRKILTMFAAGSKLDAMRLAHSYFPQFMEKGSLLPLGELIERDKDEINLDDFYPEALMGCRAEDGVVYGLPVDIAGWAIYYNRGLFDKAGLSYPDETWTWDTMLDMAKKLTLDLDGDGIIDQYGIYIKVKMSVLEVLAGQAGALLMNEDNTQCAFNSPEGIEVIKLLHDLIIEHKVVPPPAFRADQNVFAAEKVAMVMLMRGDVTGLRQSLSFDWDVGPVPKWPGKEPSALIVGGFNPWVIAKSTDHPEESWRFLKYFTGVEASMNMAKTGRFVPARKSVAESPAFLEGSPPEHNEYFLDLIRTPNKVFVQRFPAGKKLDKIFRANFQYLIEGKFDVEGAAAQIEKDVNKLIDDIRAQKEEAGS
jgi:multiple sugar transport system substrate-binding protein